MSQLLTSKELAEKADVDPRKLRRILRKEFKGAGKTSVEGKREEYRFNPDDPIVQQIIDRIQGQPAEKPKPEKPKAQKAKAIQPKGKKPEFGKPSVLLLYGLALPYDPLSPVHKIRSLFHPLIQQSKY